MTTATTANVATPCKAYNEMACGWEIVDDLLGGTKRMREAGVKWLPTESVEKPQEYQARLGRSFLYGALADTIEKYVSKPFSKKVVVTGLPDELAEMENDIDMRGTSLTEFARALMQDGLGHGLSHIFVDYSKVAEEKPGGEVALPNKAQEREMGARPYFQHFHSSSVIAWPSEIRNGREVLTSLRVKEKKTVPDGPYGEKEVECIRLFTETTVQTFEKDVAASEYTSTAPVAHTLGGIPLVTFYVAPDGFMRAKVPFESLAYMNVRHWQLESDLGNIIHVCCVPILHRTGITQEEKDKGKKGKAVEIGAYRIVDSTDPNAQMNYVEPTGNGVKLGQEERQKVEVHMEILGLAPALERTADQTATGRGIDDSNAKSSIQGWIRVLESALENAFRIAADLVGVELPDDFSVDIFQDFGINAQAQMRMEALKYAHGAGTITNEELLKGLQKLGVFDETFSPEEAVEAKKREGPPLGMITNLDTPGFGGQQPPAKPPVEETREPVAA